MKLTISGNQHLVLNTSGMGVERRIVVVCTNLHEVYPRPPLPCSTPVPKVRYISVSSLPNASLSTTSANRRPTLTQFPLIQMIPKQAVGPSAKPIFKVFTSWATLQVSRLSHLYPEIAMGESHWPLGPTIFSSCCTLTQSREIFIPRGR